MTHIIFFSLFLFPLYLNSYSSECPAKTVIITGEPSGEELAYWYAKKVKLHAAEEIYILASDTTANKLNAVKLEGFDALKKTNILNGLFPLLKELIQTNSLYRKLEQHILDLQPSKIILIDFPWVNLRLARTIKKHLPKTEIIFIAPPELWFWGCWKIDALLRDFCDSCVVLYPHESDWYKAKNIKATWLGYPYLEEFRSCIGNAQHPLNHLVLLPGSREEEVARFLPIFCKALKKTVMLQECKVFLLKAPSVATEQITAILEKENLHEVIDIIQADEKSRLQNCFYALSKPGTNTLQLALLGVPHAIIFTSSFLSELFLRYIIKPKALSLPNLLSGEPLVDEFRGAQATPEVIAQHLDKLFFAFKNQATSYTLRQQKLDNFRKAFLEDND